VGGLCVLSVKRVHYKLASKNVTDYHGRYILTGSYDSVVRVYNHSQQALHAISGHTGPVTSVCWIPSRFTSELGHSILSGSHDGTARITPVADLDSESSAGSLHSTASLRLHMSPLSSVAANGKGSHVLTAGWDGLLGVFTTDIPEKDEVLDDEDEPSTSRKKRRKVESSEPQAKRKVKWPYPKSSYF
jgi:ribosome biogenesis protein YTM1